MPVVDVQFDEADYDRSFYGVYSQYAGFESSTLDLYYLGFDDERNGAAVATDFSLHTFGGRLNGKLAGKWLYDIEGADQGGQQSGVSAAPCARFASSSGARSGLRLRSAILRCWT